MARMGIPQARATGSGIAAAIEELGMDFVDFVKQAKSIAVVSLVEPSGTEALLDAIAFHSRVPVHVLGPEDAARAVEGTIPRELSSGSESGLRMPIRRPAAIFDADQVIVLAPMPQKRATSQYFAIAQYVFATWFVPQRASSPGMIESHEPWFEGGLRDAVLSDVYAQRPVALSILDGSREYERVIAGFDPVAVDAVAAFLSGQDADDIGYLSVLSSQGLGVSTLAKINVPLSVFEG